ncbi:hypothetical protein BS17DRAFT_711916, partial [Gyrodon lividus]
VEKLIATYTGVEAIKHDMCPKRCLAFTGPFAGLDACPMCGTSWWKEQILQGTCGCTKVPAQKFVTIPIVPQLQAIF